MHSIPMPFGGSKETPLIPYGFCFLRLITNPINLLALGHREHSGALRLELEASFTFKQWSLDDDQNQHLRNSSR
jgi:hypothetical protein